MGANISRLTDAQLFIDRGIDLIRKRIVTEENGIITIDPEKIDNGMPVNFVIYELLNSGYGFKGDVVDEIGEAFLKGATGKRFYSRDYVAWIDRGRIVITRIGHDDSCEVELREDQARVYCGNQVLIAEHTDIDNIDTPVQPENVALIDMDKISFPLKLRRWKEGDCFQPFGMESNKKVSDYLIDAKVSMPEKQRQFVLLNGDDIVWLVGRRIDNRYRIGKDTENILRITQIII
jgi:tRNA(Ile)-lysidine synthetase, C-terminal domain